jgi:hypothetical protein
MFELAQQLSSTGADLAAFVWLPLLIWTILAIAVILLLNVYKDIHVQYHYHARLALIFALPAGLTIAGLIELISGWLSAGAEPVAMKFIIVQTPIEITVGNPETYIPLYGARFLVWNRLLYISRRRLLFTVQSSCVNTFSFSSCSDK